MTRDTTPSRLLVSDETLKDTYQQLQCMRATAAAVGLSPETIKRRLRGLGVDTSRKKYGQNAANIVTDEQILESMKQTGNIGYTAEALGISRRTVERRLKAAGHTPKTEKRAPAATQQRDNIKRVLQEHGPLEVSDIAAELNIDSDRVYDAIKYARDTTGTEHFRVHKFKRRVGERGKPIVIYDLGPGEDAPRPKINRLKAARESHARWRERNRAKLRAERRKTPITPWEQLLQR